jgi:hypothetical protein
MILCTLLTFSLSEFLQKKLGSITLSSLKENNKNNKRYLYILYLIWSSIIN